MGYIAFRLAKISSKEFKMARTLLEIDEASKCLTIGDEEAMKKAQERAKASITAHRAFKALYRQKRRELRDKADGKGKGKGKGKHGGKGKRLPVAKHPTPANFAMKPQAAIKPFTPPDTRLWKSSTGNWHTRVRNQGECCRAIHTRGEDAAVRLVLGSAWQTWCLLEGLDEETNIPWDGLLYEEEGLESDDEA